MQERDKTIDLLRGLAMVWVIVVHVLYWGNFFRNGYFNVLKSFCLFEMPLFFFVTGAGNSFRETNGYFRFVFKRYIRFLIPYWVFALICAALSIAHWESFGRMDPVTAVKVLISWLIPVDRQMTPIAYLTWALWFVPVYLCVTLLIPVLKQIKASKNAAPFLFLHIALFVLVCVLDLGWIQNVVFYSLWTYIGLFYKEISIWYKEPRFRRCAGLTSIIGAITIVVLYLLDKPIDMQYNKFPPNLIFGVYSVVVMSCLFLLLPNICKANVCIGKTKWLKKIMDLFMTRSMTIFLYQVYAFNLTIPFADRIVSGNTMLAAGMKAVICFITTVPVCAALALVFGKIETVCNRMLSKENHTKKKCERT